MTNVDPPNEQCDVQIHVADCVPTIQSSHNASLQADVDSMATQNLQIGDDCLLCDVHDPSTDDPLHQMNPPNMSLRQSDCILSQTSQSRLGTESITYSDDNPMAGIANSTSSTQNVYAGYTGSATFCIEPTNVGNTSIHEVASPRLIGDKFCTAQSNEHNQNMSLTTDDCNRQENVTSCQYEQKTLDQMNNLYNPVAPSERTVTSSLPSISEDQQSCSEITVTPVPGAQYHRVQKRKIPTYSHMRSQNMNLHEPCSSGYETSSAHGSSPYTSPDSTHSCNPGSCDNTMANTSELK